MNQEIALTANRSKCRRIGVCGHPMNLANVATGEFCADNVWVLCESENGVRVEIDTSSHTGEIAVSVQPNFQWIRIRDYQGETY